MPVDMLKALEELLIKNNDLFAWVPAEMPRIDPKIISHKLSIPLET